MNRYTRTPLYLTADKVRYWNTRTNGSIYGQRRVQNSNATYYDPGNSAGRVQRTKGKKIVTYDPRVENVVGCYEWDMFSGRPQYDTAY